MTTNARTLVQESASGSQSFSDLPTTQQAQEMVTLGRDVQSGNTEPAKDKKEPAKRKFAGVFESVEELERGYENLNTEKGRLGVEVGQLRALSHQLLDLKKTETQNNGASRKPVQVTSDDMLRDPEKAISSVVDQRTEALERELANTRQAVLSQAFVNRHPTFQTDMDDPTFQKWVGRSIYRQQLGERAKAGDFVAADELFTSWEDHKAVLESAQNKQSEKKPNDKALKDAAMVTGGGRGPDEGAAKPIYSSAKLIEKRIKDPNGYYDPAFQAIITQAYIEGRVK